MEEAIVSGLWKWAKADEGETVGSKVTVLDRTWTISKISKYSEFGQIHGEMIANPTEFVSGPVVVLSLIPCTDE